MIPKYPDYFESLQASISTNMAADFTSVWGRRRVRLFFRSSYLKCWDLHIGFVEPLQKRVLRLQQNVDFYTLVFCACSFCSREMILHLEVMSGYRTISIWKRVTPAWIWGARNTSACPRAWTHSNRIFSNIQLTQCSRLSYQSSY